MLHGLPLKSFDGVSQILKSIFSAVISTLIIGALLAAWNDYVYKADNLAGFWRAKFETHQSEIERFEAMKTNYMFILQQEGHVIRGASEKVSEETGGSVEHYQPYDRIHGDVSGTISYKVYSNSTLDLVLRESGRLRKTSSILHLQVITPDRLKGTFSSTAANSKGSVVLTRVN